VSWIDSERLVSFILQCQDEDAGGIADRPGDESDIFHSFFGICGLSLMGYFEKARLGDNSSTYSSYREIDPTYALPKDLVESLKLPYQRLTAL
jgi:geranylgeranyl transferase type-2 subunit beta